MTTPTDASNVVSTKKSNAPYIIFGLIIGGFVFLACICIVVFLWIRQNESFLSGKMTEEEIDLAVDAIGTMIDEPNEYILEDEGYNLDDEWFGNTEGLESIDNDEYTFYYPQGFEESVGTIGVEHFYASSEINSNENYNFISLAKLTPGQEEIPECSSYGDLIAQSMQESNPNVVVDSYYTEAITRGGFSGCQLNYQITNGEVITYADQTILQNLDSGLAYIITVGYDTLLSNDYESLKSAQSSFIIK